MLNEAKEYVKTLELVLRYMKTKGGNFYLKKGKAPPVPSQ